MLDIKRIRQNPQELVDALKARNKDIDIAPSCNGTRSAAGCWPKARRKKPCATRPASRLPW